MINNKLTVVIHNMHHQPIGLE